MVSPIPTRYRIAWSFRLCVCMSSVTLVHPTKAVGRNEIPFGTDTHVVPSVVVLDRGPGPLTIRGFGVGTPVSSDAA